MDARITMQHGGGGLKTSELLAELVFPALHNTFLSQAHDGAVFSLQAPLAFTTDSFVVSPIFFKGGDIGSLSIHGTVNDLAMCGAIPKYISLAFILEEGFLIADLQRILTSIAGAAKKAGVQIITGDTKVVEKGKGDKIYINTTGIGVLHKQAVIQASRVGKDCALLINNSIATHGMAIMSEREGLSFESDIMSDSTNLNYVVENLLDHFGRDVLFLRDATRGGLASVLLELANTQNLGIHLIDSEISVEKQVASACEILGLDPLYVANEGVFVLVVKENKAAEILELLRKNCPKAARIGSTTEAHPKKIMLQSSFGGRRIVSPFLGEQLPRIC